MQAKVREEAGPVQNQEIETGEAENSIENYFQIGHNPEVPETLESDDFFIRTDMDNAVDRSTQTD